MQYVDFTDYEKPTLVMEMLELGSLKDQHKVAPITMEETITLLHQSLRALKYLHSQKLTHRDIKPANILVQSRAPFRIKLADFGLTKKGSFLETTCGTPLYTAPEIGTGQAYNASVETGVCIVAPASVVDDGMGQSLEASCKQSLADDRSR